MHWLKLYARCQQFNALPDDGGILDQGDRTMAMLDIIGEVIGKRKRHKDKIAQQAAEREKLKRQGR